MDVINSWLELLTMTSHSAKAPFNYHTEYPKFWDWWIKDCTMRMKHWYKKVINDAKQNKVPTLFVRYEDLVHDVEPELVAVMKFLLSTNSLEDTNAMRRIE